MKAFTLTLATFVFLSLQVFGLNHQDQRPLQLSVQTKRMQLPNFGVVAPGLYRGGRPDPEAFSQLKTLNIKTVVNLQGAEGIHPKLGWIVRKMQRGENQAWIDYEKKTLQSMNIDTVNFSFSSLRPLTNKEKEGIEFLLQLLNDPTRQPIYIHCEFGKDRTGLIIALYRVLYQDWPKQKAYDEMIAMGHSKVRQIFTGNIDDYFWEMTKNNP